MITKKYYKLIRVSYEDQQYLTLTNTSGTVGGFSVTKGGNPSNKNLEYSLNGVDWVTYDLTNLPTIEIPADGHIYLRGNNSSGLNDEGNYYKFGVSVNHTISGNLFSLRNTDPTTFSTYTNVLRNEFRSLFQGDSYLTNAENLITTQITSTDYRSFNSTFYECINLQKAPNLSGITNVGSYCFESIFDKCQMLNTVYAPNVSTWEPVKFSSWLNNAGSYVSGTKTFYAPTGVEIPTGNYGIPSGWTRVDY